MDYKAKFTDIKAKISHNSEHVDHVISGMGRTEENRIFRCLKIP